MSIVSTTRQESIVRGVCQGFIDLMGSYQMIHSHVTFVIATQMALKKLVRVSVGNVIAKRVSPENDVRSVSPDIEGPNAKNVVVTLMERWMVGNVSPIANAR